MSSFQFKKLKGVDTKTKCLIYGYNRVIEKTLSHCDLFQNVPILINSLCVLFYAIPEYFNIAGSNCEISDDQKTINHSGCDDYENTSYGLMQISSTENIECEWTFKISRRPKEKSISQIDDRWGISIGISSNDESDVDFAAYGKNYGDGDVIQMILKMKKKEIDFFKNGRYQGVAFKNIATGKKINYRLAISMDNDLSITMTDFIARRY